MMSTIDQQRILNSIHEALVPGASLIDGRTEQEWLRFLSDFASLINFYDHNNIVHGNWTPFLLKDPVFLMAAISRTAFSKLYALYLRICHKLEQLLLPSSDKKDLPVSFNQLFDHLNRIFVQIRQWTWYMQRSVEDYPLKTYVIRQIKVTFANYFQAINSLRQELFASSLIAGIDPTDPAILWQFEGYEERIWREGEFPRPYWEVLGLLHPLKDNTAAAIFKSLSNAGDVLFNFLQVIIKQANTEFGRLIKVKSNYPDTTLLRTFINLLKIHQDQLNEIGGKHLRFYYKDILKQVERPAIADHAYIFAGLTKKDALVNLPAGTLFDAGVDAQKNPVVFNNTEAVILNPAVITGAYTLCGAPGSDQLSLLQLQLIASPGVVQKDADGKTLSWDTFGTGEASPLTQTALGITFASPMLLLREGTRQIVFSLACKGDMNLDMMRLASCYLSTQNAWFGVNADIQPVQSPSAYTITITIQLKITDPAIECFLINPDGIESSWPMFKMVFNQVNGYDVPPPVLHEMKIDVTVSGVETVQLYNDFGALSTKVAFPLFGPTPVNGSNFIIGSNEIFSKPLSSLTVKLNWAALPPDFSVYYKAYNLYLNHELVITKPADESWLQKIFGGKKTTADPVLPDEGGPFNNNCFTVAFQVLQEQLWTPVVFNTVAVQPVTVQPVPVVPVVPPVSPAVPPAVPVVEPATTQPTVAQPVTTPPADPAVPPAVPVVQPETTQPAVVQPALLVTGSNTIPPVASNLLFVEDNGQQPSLSAYSATGIPVTACDPFLQNEPLKFTEVSTSGFMKMELTGPDFGFGSGIYSNVVSAVALNNAQVLYNHGDGVYVDSPLVPFTPKLKSFSADYSASVQYSFDKDGSGTVVDNSTSVNNSTVVNNSTTTNNSTATSNSTVAGSGAVVDSEVLKDYPVQVFLYAPFGNYPVYDNLNQPPVQEHTIGSAGSTENDPSGVPLYAAFNFDGFLFLELDNLMPASSLNLYFELARKYITGTVTDNKVGYYYLSTTGWLPLTVLADGTNNLSCSGIIRLNIPADITNESKLMPGSSYWIAMVADDISSVAGTIFISTNGVEVQRSGDAAAAAATTPDLAAGTITKTKTPFPQISTLQQPFPSFGGKAAEDQLSMNQRISSRLKTKDRAITTMDYFSLICQKFNGIYYSTSVYDSTVKITNVYVVKSIESQTAPNAFLPMVSSCQEEQIQLFLQQKTSAFSVIRVANPDFQSVSVCVTITIQTGYEFSAVQQQIRQALNIYLSPWIKDIGPQIQIYQDISDVEISAFIKNITGVATVESVSFKTWMWTTTPAEAESKAVLQQIVKPLKTSALFVSNMIHQISLNPNFL